MVHSGFNLYCIGYNTHMKWPESLTLIRHDTSAYNHAKKVKEADPVYQEFKAAYEADWRSSDTERLAHEVWEHFSLGIGDHDTPLSPVAEGEKSQAEVMAAHLRDRVQIPDIIFVSPYLRTHQTLERMIEGWPELQDARTVEDDRLREQEHGIALIYNDYRVFHVLNPNQKRLRDIEGPYWYRFPPVSYTHLDVYKRQAPSRVVERGDCCHECARRLWDLP